MKHNAMHLLRNTKMLMLTPRTCVQRSSTRPKTALTNPVKRVAKTILASKAGLLCEQPRPIRSGFFLESLKKCFIHDHKGVNNGEIRSTVIVPRSHLVEISGFP